MKKMKNRFSNPLFWMALISLIYQIVNSINTNELPPEELTITLILNILIGCGVVSDYKGRRDS